jgi:hypothetical protein
MKTSLSSFCWLLLLLPVDLMLMWLLLLLPDPGHAG